MVLPQWCLLVRALPSRHVFLRGDRRGGEPTVIAASHTRRKGNRTLDSGSLPSNRTLDSGTSEGGSRNLRLGSRAHILGGCGYVPRTPRNRSPVAPCASFARVCAQGISRRGQWHTARSSSGCTCRKLKHSASLGPEHRRLASDAPGDPPGLLLELVDEGQLFAKTAFGVQASACTIVGLLAPCLSGVARG